MGRSFSSKHSQTCLTVEQQTPLIKNHSKLNLYHQKQMQYSFKIISDMLERWPGISLLFITVSDHSLTIRLLSDNVLHHLKNLIKNTNPSI